MCGIARINMATSADRSAELTAEASEAMPPTAYRDASGILPVIREPPEAASLSTILCFRPPSELWSVSMD
jgi:hypothetical protein